MQRKAFTVLLIVVALVVALGAAGPVAGAAPGGARPKYVEGQVLVKLKAGHDLADIDRLALEYQAEVLDYFEFIDVYLLGLAEEVSVEQATGELGESASVAYAEPNGLHYIDMTFPNDPDFSDLWGLDNYGQTGGTPDADIDAPEAWDMTTGSSSVVIAVIDSGVDMSHPDLAANIYANPGEVPGNGIDDDGNGFIDDVNGWDFSAGDNDPSPAGGACGGHGTHVAGTIGAVGDNGVGIAGVNWDVQVMPLKAFEPYLGIWCTASDADLIAAIQYQTMMGVRVSSNSWGGGAATGAMQAAIQASKSVFAAAAGNDGTSNDTSPHYPSSYPLDNIVAVAATNDNDARASFSNYGATSVDLGAPGEDIYSTLPGNNYGSYNGTSMATPHVSGVAGLLFGQDPGRTNNEVIWCILNGTDPIGLPVVTGGRLNAYGALDLCGSVMAITVALAPVGPTDVSPGGVMRTELTLTNNTAAAVTGDLYLYTVLDDGRVRKPRNPKVITLPAGGTLTRQFSKRVPASMPPGSSIEVYGQIETATSFDEDYVVYNVVP